MFNPPIVQAGENACYGSADPVVNFGDTPDTEKLIEQPTVQKRLLKGDTPYQCKYCKLVFFVERWIIDSYSKNNQWGKPATDNKPPRGFLCIKSHYVIDRTKCPPQITSDRSGTVAGITPITIPIKNTGPLSDANRRPTSS